MKIYEDDELIKFFDWVAWKRDSDIRYDAIIHVANERKATVGQHNKLKRKGVKPGVFDVLCFSPTERYRGLAVELKIKPNKLTENQIKFGQMLFGFGWCVKIAWSGDELIDIVERYINEIPS